MADDPHEIEVFPWPYTADRPQRYMGNYQAYRRLGGPVDIPKFVQGFVADGYNRSDMARFYFFCLAFDQIVKEDIPGDLAELGVYKGHTASLLATIARARGVRAFLLDTFTGFDTKDIKGVDADAREHSFNDTSLEAVRSLVGEANVTYVPGYFPDTARELPSENHYCLVHIDCDLYAPIQSALEYFYPRMAPGGYLIVHDYSSMHWGGAEKAADEFFADKPEPLIPLPDDAGSVVIRKMRSRDPKANWLMRRRAKFVRDEWISSADGGIRDLLGAGWSGPEKWGVWGVGDSHELQVVVPSGAEHAMAVELQADVHAALVGERNSQCVRVVVDGRLLADWTFSQQRNRGVRSVTIPMPPATTGQAEPRVLTVAFQPTSVAAPADLDSSLTERRMLGLALHRIRMRLHAA